MDQLRPLNICTETSAINRILPYDNPDASGRLGWLILGRSGALIRINGLTADMNSANPPKTGRRHNFVANRVAIDQQERPRAPLQGFAKVGERPGKHRRKKRIE